MCVQDILNSSAPDKQWTHNYPIRQNEQGRSYATLEVEWSYRIDMPAGFVQEVVDAALHSGEDDGPVESNDQNTKAENTLNSYTSAAARAEDLSFIETHFPLVFDILCKTRTLERGDHVIVGSLLSFLLGWFRRDSAFLVPLAVLISRMESLHVRQTIQRSCDSSAMPTAG